MNQARGQQDLWHHHYDVIVMQTIPSYCCCGNFQGFYTSLDFKMHILYNFTFCSICIIIVYTGMFSCGHVKS